MKKFFLVPLLLISAISIYAQHAESPKVFLNNSKAEVQEGDTITKESIENLKIVFNFSEDMKKFDLIKVGISSNQFLPTKCREIGPYLLAVKDFDASNKEKIDLIYGDMDPIEVNLKPSDCSFLKTVYNTNFRAQINGYFITGEKYVNNYDMNGKVTSQTKQLIYDEGTLISEGVYFQSGLQARRTFDFPVLLPISFKLKQKPCEIEYYQNLGKRNVLSSKE